MRLNRGVVAIFIIAVGSVLTVMKTRSSEDQTDEPCQTDSIGFAYSEKVSKVIRRGDSAEMVNTIADCDYKSASDPANGNYYKEQKARLLVKTGEYEEARKLLVEEGLCRRLYSKEFFPGYDRLVSLQLDAMTADRDGRFLKVSNCLYEMERILREQIFSERFNPKEYFRKPIGKSSDIEHDRIFGWWLNTLYTIGDKEMMETEFRHATRDYEVNEKFELQTTLEARSILTPEKLWE